MQEQAGADIYEKKNQPSNATGGVQLGPESAAFAAVQRAAALAGPSMIHCDLCNVWARSCSGLLLYTHLFNARAVPMLASVGTCTLQSRAPLSGAPTRCFCTRAANIVQANFAGDAQYKQHVEGPIHRKALAKAEAQRQRDLQLGASKGAAESAMVRRPALEDPTMTCLSYHDGLYNLCTALSRTYTAMQSWPFLAEELLFRRCLGSVMRIGVLRLQLLGQMAVR